MGTHGKWFITSYAIERYRLRIDPIASDGQALHRLIAASETACLVRELVPGIELWRVGSPIRCQCVVATDGPGLPQLLTVLTEHSSPEVIVRRRTGLPEERDVDYFAALDDLMRKD